MGGRINNGGKIIVSAIFDMFNGLRNNSDWGFAQRCEVRVLPESDRYCRRGPQHRNANSVMSREPRLICAKRKPASVKTNAGLNFRNVRHLDQKSESPSAEPSSTTATEPTTAAKSALVSAIDEPVECPRRFFAILSGIV